MYTGSDKIWSAWWEPSEQYEHCTMYIPFGQFGPLCLFGLFVFSSAKKKVSCSSRYNLPFFNNKGGALPVWVVSGWVWRCSRTFHWFLLHVLCRWSQIQIQIQIQIKIQISKFGGTLASRTFHRVLLLHVADLADWVVKFLQKGLCGVNIKWIHKTNTQL